MNCASLLSATGLFDRWRASPGGWLTDRYGQAPERTADGYLKVWYLSVPGYLAALVFHHERRVPSLRPEHLSLRMARPRPHPDSIALLAERFVCLPDDPATGTPEATVTPDERALAAVPVQRPGRLGRHTLPAATDVLDDSDAAAGRHGGDEGAGAVDGALLPPDRLAPLTSASTMRPVAGELLFPLPVACGQGPCPRALPR